MVDSVLPLVEVEYSAFVAIARPKLILNVPGRLLYYIVVLLPAEKGGGGKRWGALGYVFERQTR